MTTAAFDGPDLVVSGAGDAPASVRLVGPRVSAAGVVSTDAEGWTARVPLRAARWGGAALPLPSGRYRLELDGADLPASVVPSALRPGLRAGYADGVVTVARPVDPAYDALEAQEALERRYAATRPQGLENAVFLESAEGRAAGGDPLAIDRALARAAPGVVRYWSVVDLSVAVPDGAVAVVDGSPAWWRARGAARLLVVDGPLRRLFSRRHGQVVLQTGRGTPLVRVGLHRRGIGPRRIAATIREARRWNVLLAENPAAERVLRRAFAFVDRPIWVEGRPADDVLTSGDDGATRRELGIGADERVVLLAPAGEGALARIEPAELAARTGAVVLLRRQAPLSLDGETDAEVEAAVTGDRVVDVTDYPESARLLLAADVLVTDHSTLAVDAGASGTRTVLLAPERPRDLSLDLVAHAPGPVVADLEQLVAAIAADPTADDAERAAAWRARFNARDDGRAAARVVARILDEAWVDRE